MPETTCTVKEWGRAYDSLEKCFRTDIDKDQCAQAVRKLTGDQARCLYGSGTMQTVCSRYDEPGCQSMPPCAKPNVVPTVSCGQKAPEVPTDKRLCEAVITCGNVGLWLLQCPGKDGTTNYYRTIPEKTEGGFRCAWSQTPEAPETVQPEADACDAIYMPPDPCPSKTDPTQPQRSPPSSGDISEYWKLGGSAVLSLAAVAVCAWKVNKPRPERVRHAKQNVADAHYMNQHAPVFRTDDIVYKDGYDPAQLFRGADSFETAKRQITTYRPGSPDHFAMEGRTDAQQDMYRTLVVMHDSLNNFPLANESMYISSFLTGTLAGDCGLNVNDFLKRFRDGGYCKQLFEINQDDASRFVGAVQTRHASSVYGGKAGMEELFRQHNISMDAGDAFTKLHKALGLDSPATPATSDPYRLGWDIASHIGITASGDMQQTVTTLQQDQNLFAQREVVGLLNTPDLTAAGYVRRELSANTASGSGAQRTMASLPLQTALANIREDQQHSGPGNRYGPGKPRQTLMPHMPHLALFGLDGSREADTGGGDARDGTGEGAHGFHGSE